MNAATSFARLAAACLLLTGSIASAAERPNIVLIMADDLGVECLSTYGCLDYKTPHLDALAASGAKFTHAYSQPLCTPTRVQIMTGKYNFRNYPEFGYLNPDEITFGDLLRDAGYKTSIVGKWQLSGPLKSATNPSSPVDWGFDDYCLWQLNNLAPGKDGRGSRYWNPFLECNGEKLSPGNDVYGPDVTAQHLMDFIEKNRNESFFAYYPMILTHGPYDSTPDSDSRGKNQVRYFKDMVEYMDKIVGRIVAKLDELKLRDNTIVIFTGDNGTGKEVRTNTKNGVIAGGKGTTTDAGTHVAFIVSWPGKIEPGTVTNRLVDFTDVLPSLLAATGTELPSSFKTDGVPFLDANGLARFERAFTYCWYEPRHGANSARNNAVFARNHRYKLYSDGRFFDVTKTPDEKAEDVLKGNLTAEAETAKAKLQLVIDKYAAEGGVTEPGVENTSRPRDRRARNRNR